MCESEQIDMLTTSDGIPNAEIYEMMAKARLEATIRQIPDEKTVEELVEFNNNL